MCETFASFHGQKNSFMRIFTYLTFCEIEAREIRYGLSKNPSNFISNLNYNPAEEVHSFATKSVNTDAAHTSSSLPYLTYHKSSLFLQNPVKQEIEPTHQTHMLHL